jgi:hypothetical protein
VKFAALFLLLAQLLPCHSAWAGCASALDARDARYGHFDQGDPGLVDAGVRLPLGDASYTQCASTCFLNVLAKIRKVRGIRPAFGSPVEEMTFLLTDFAARIGFSVEDIRKDGVSFTEARKLYKAYLDFLGIRNEESLFGLKGSGELTDRKSGFDPEDLRGTVKSGEAWIVGVAIIPKDPHGSGSESYARETSTDDIDWSHALLVTGFDPADKDRFFFQDPAQKNWQRAGRIRKVWVKERKGYVYRIVFEEHGAEHSDQPSDVVLIDSAIRFKF